MTLHTLLRLAVVPLLAVLLPTTSSAQGIDVRGYGMMGSVTWSVAASRSACRSGASSSASAARSSRPTVRGCSPPAIACSRWVFPRR